MHKWFWLQGTTYATLATWTAYNQPSAPSVVSKSPNLTAVCEGQDVSATLSAERVGLVARIPSGSR
jgi:hypothetical protein